jgi:hypothetical protein
MRKRFVLAALGVAAFATPAAARNWYLTSESAYATNMNFVDRDSIQASGTSRIAHVYQVRSAPDEDGAAAVDATMEYDCVEPRGRFMRLVGFDEQSRQIADTPGSRIWRAVARGTQEYEAREFACSDGRSLDASASWGVDYPFDRARALLAQHRAEDVRNAR